MENRWVPAFSVGMPSKKSGYEEIGETSASCDALIRTRNVEDPEIEALMDSNWKERAQKGPLDRDPALTMCFEKPVSAGLHPFSSISHAGLATKAGNANQ
jgi:hypothetical protein